jgi:hypothetical protein
VPERQVGSPVERLGSGDSGAAEEEEEKDR